MNTQMQKILTETETVFYHLKIVILAVENTFLDKRGPLIKYTQPTDKKLRERIEYDMDAQDKYWLEMMKNKEKSTNQGDDRSTDTCTGFHRNMLKNVENPQVDYSDSIFEAVMDNLEKEWFNLVTIKLDSPLYAIQSFIIQITVSST